jgi:hypothetical protein
MCSHTKIISVMSFLIRTPISYIKIQLSSQLPYSKCCHIRGKGSNEFDVDKHLVHSIVFGKYMYVIVSYKKWNHNLISKFCNNKTLCMLNPSTCPNLKQENNVKVKFYFIIYFMVSFCILEGIYISLKKLQGTS